jgi:hypothetical protein
VRRPEWIAKVEGVAGTGEVEHRSLRRELEAPVSDQPLACLQIQDGIWLDAPLLEVHEVRSRSTGKLR